MAGSERLYFVVETKGSLFDDDLRKAEIAKITCGKEHFKALSSEGAFVHYIAPARHLADVFEASQTSRKPKALKV
ncbi:MAG: restriction endonuclease [Spirochaetales bacterium]